MAEETTEQVLARVTWESNTQTFARETAEGLNTVSNMTNSLSNIFTRLMGVSIQLQQSNLTLTRSYWALADAKRESFRWSQQNYQLDVKMAQLQVRLAQRQLLITQRTGRLLDVEVARLQVSIAQRDATRANWMVEDKRRQVNRNLLIAEQQLQILEKQRHLMAVQFGMQIGLLITQMAVMTAIILKQTAAEAVRQAVFTAGASLIVSAAAGYAAYRWAKGMQQQIDTGYSEPPPSAQTGEGESKTVERTGMALVHEGETISRGDNIDNSQHSSVTNITINAPSNATANSLLDMLQERFFLKTQMLKYGTPR